MQQKTSIIITIATAILLAVVFYISGKPPAEVSLGSETIPPNEAIYISQILSLVETQRGAADVETVKHSKQHACVKATFQVISNLELESQTPLFQPGAQYPAWIRFSSTAEASPDTTPGVRGLTLKLLEVPGEKLTGAENAHDLVFSSNAVFPFEDVESYAKALAAISQNQPFRYFFNPLRPRVNSFRIYKARLQKHRDLLAMRWWSVVPFKFGEQGTVKYSLRPCADSASRKRNYGHGLTDNFLQERLQESLSASSACFDFMVQFQTDANKMPIEDSTVVWDEAAAPYQPIARLNIPAQSFNQQQTQICEQLTFNPWRALPQHQPLGGINRARREIYQRSAQ